jgi:hypothetical protein
VAVYLYPDAKENSDIQVRCRVLVLVYEPVQKRVES